MRGVHRTRGGQSMSYRWGYMQFSWGGCIGLGGVKQCSFWWPRVTFAKSDPPHVPWYSTVAKAPVVFVQWSFVTFHCIFIPNPWCLSCHAYKPITIAQTWQLSSNGHSTNNLLRGYRCYRSTLVQKSSFTTRNQLVETLPLLPFDICPKLLQKEPTTCQEAPVPLLPFDAYPRTPSHKRGLPSMYLHRTPVFVHDEEALPAPSVAASVLRLPWPPLQARRDRTCI